MPPSSTDRKISSTTIEMITKQLGKKADEIYMRDVLAMHKEDIDEAKTIALSVKNKFENRACEKEEEIKEMMKAINSFKNVKLVGVISVVIFVLGWVSQFYTLKDKADDTADSMVKVEQSVVKVEKSVEENAVVFKEHIEQFEEAKKKAVKEKEVEQKKDEVQLDTILDAIKKSRRR